MIDYFHIVLEEKKGQRHLCVFFSLNLIIWIVLNPKFLRLTSLTHDPVTILTEEQTNTQVQDPVQLSAIKANAVIRYVIPASHNQPMINSF